ncbi:MAG: RDD family protein [Methylococcales bacterium]|nr:MAG: RDD family protein [Methylococcales bacterium]
MSSKINKQQKPGHDILSAPSFWRRLAAQTYDFLLLIALLFLATALLLPFTAGMAVTDQHTLIYRIYLVVVSFFFYGWFWTHGGQTLGLRAWKLTVLTQDKKTLNWTQALVRFVTASVSLGFFGLGYLWILIDKDRRGWHDHLSKTTVFYNPQQKK